MLQTRFDPSEDRELVANLLRTRQEDGYEPPLQRVSSDASLERELSLLAARDTFATVIRSGSQILGLACWRHLAWDSEQLGIPTARLDLLVSSGAYQEALERKGSLLSTLSQECRLHGIRYLTARVPAGELSTVHALGRAGFDLVDGILTFSLRLDEAIRRTVNNGFEVRMFQPSDLEQVLSIARSSYTCGRFHVDRALASGVADRLYAAWVRRSCNGEEADAVVVTAKGSRVMGYVTCKLGREPEANARSSGGRIVLVATAEEARGQGVASAALQGGLDWFRKHAEETVEVGTQMQNVAACRLYESCGFRMARMNLTYRRLL
jgi:dTDP-4-amino-4,6-dideoxy-D-galactose acyltransferase